MTTTDQPYAMRLPDCLLPGPGKATVTVRVEYATGPLAHSGDLFVRYADPDGGDEMPMASTLCAEALLDPADHHLHAFLTEARDQRNQEHGIATVKVDGHVLYEETLANLLDTIERYADRSPRGDWRIGGGF